MAWLFRLRKMSVTLIKCIVIAVFANELNFLLYILHARNENFNNAPKTLKKCVSLVEKMTLKYLLKNMP